MKQKKVIIVLQAFGLGDIIFCISIAMTWIAKGYHVIWGIDPVYNAIAKHFPKIVFIDKSLLAADYDCKEITTVGNTTIMPLRWSDAIQKVPYRQVMRAKYDMLGMDWVKWKDNYWCDRDIDSELHLYYNVLGLKDGEEYNLISSQFTTGGARSRDINVSNGLKNIELKMTNGFTLIDWLHVIQNATYIHAVASSNIYLFELYELAAKEVHLYPRWPLERNHDNYQYILKKNYIYH